MAILTPNMVDSKEQTIEKIKPIIIGGQNVLLRDPNHIDINVGDSVFDIQVAELARIESERLENEKNRRETLSRERRSYTGEGKDIEVVGYSSDHQVEVIGSSNLSCVPYFKKKSNITRSLGYAGNITSQGNEPKIGSGALWKDYGHIGYVVAVENNIIIVEDSNWVKGKVTLHRLSVDNFRGFIYN